MNKTLRNTLISAVAGVAIATASGLGGRAVYRAVAGEQAEPAPPPPPPIHDELVKRARAAIVKLREMRARRTPAPGAQP